MTSPKLDHPARRRPTHDPARQGRPRPRHPDRARHRCHDPSYLSVRQEQRHADRPELWVGGRSCGLAPDALYRSLRRRAERAAIEGFRPHRLRHTAAHRWLTAGGSESGLMAVAGWTRVEMLIRYARAHAGERAAIEARRLNLGDL